MTSKIVLQKHTLLTTITVSLSHCPTVPLSHTETRTHTRTISQVSPCVAGVTFAAQLCRTTSGEAGNVASACVTCSDMYGFHALRRIGRTQPGPHPHIPTSPQPHPRSTRPPLLLNDVTPRTNCHIALTVRPGGQYYFPLGAGSTRRLEFTFVFFLGYFLT